MRVFLLAWATVSLSLLSSGRPMAAQGRGSVTITRIVADPDGKAQALNLPVAFHPSPLKAGLDESTTLKVSGAQFVRWPRGYVWPSHTAATKQFVITISGRGEVEVTGGQVIPLTPGRILLAEDLTGMGHTTRVVGTEDLVLLLVPINAQ